MKKAYVAPDMMFLRTAWEDVLTTSVLNAGNGDEDFWSFPSLKRLN